MNRAAVLIGVQKAHSLPLLQAVMAGVAGMEEWALFQGIPRERIKVVTDKEKPVTPDCIKKAISDLLEPGNLDQLIVYFAGHGVNVQYAEYWLLSDAIIDSDAAINVKASEERARYSGIPHVVFISDACRTAAVGIQAQGILGSTIFRNPIASGPEKQVDLFFATLIGDPALEIQDPNSAAQCFQAVYTEALLEALRGQRPEVIEQDSNAGGSVVRPWPLKEFLAKELPIRVFQATHGPNPRNQQPDARITSRPNAWISVVPASVTSSPPPKFGAPPAAHALKYSELAQAASQHMETVTRSMLTNKGLELDIALELGPKVETLGQGNLDIFSKVNRQFEEDVRRLAQPFGILHMETRCGFKVRGARVTRCIGSFASSVSNDGTEVRIEVPEGSVASYLIEFHNGTGALLPAIGGFLASLTLKDGQLIDVAYEPSEFTDRWHVFENRADDIRALRAAVAAATRAGTFRLQGEDASLLARRMQLAKGIDPSLALYAAHAYRDLGERQRIREMAVFIRNDLGFCPFDIALLDGQLNDYVVDPKRKDIQPFLPMLAQSWPLLSAYDVKLPDRLNGIRQHLLPGSLWTLLDPDGVNLVADVVPRGGVE